uniref:NAD(+) diphosphatase n=1 Tax=Angiostrongylus cantonensis TaxID=6313 RepID=A0A0K0DG73_ANGCA
MQSCYTIPELSKKLGDYGLSFDTTNSCLLDAVEHSDSEIVRAELAKTFFLSSFMFQSLIRWSRVYLRCPKCGSPLRMRVSKSAAHCVACPRIYYPTVAILQLYPVCITLLSDPTDSHVLLVRHKGSPGGVYTAIAGFAHPGESLEDCVRREVAEEVGVTVSKVVSLNRSQPWPILECSLMCAHYAVADMSMKIDICPNELEAARWYTREEVAVALQRTLDDPFLKA